MELSNGLQIAVIFSMQIRWRKFTNESIRHGHALGRAFRHALTPRVGSLLTVVLLNFVVLEGQIGQIEWVDPDALGRIIQSRLAPSAFQKIEGQGATGESTTTDHRKT